jgi:hypothetical protein
MVQNFNLPHGTVGGLSAWGGLVAQQPLVMLIVFQVLYRAIK